VTEHSQHRNIVSAALAIACLTVVVRLASVGKELLIAWRFGTSDDLDAFLISLVVPIGIVTVLAGSFNASLVPIYIEAKQNGGAEAARRLFQSVIGWVLLLLILTSLVAVLAAPLCLRVLGSGFSPEKLHFALKLVYLNSALIILGGVAALCTAALNAERQFAIAAATPIASPLLTMVFLWLAPGWRTYALVTGLIVGAATEMVVLAVSLKRCGLSLAPRWPEVDVQVRRLSAQFFPVVMGSILNSGNSIVDQGMAAMLAGGSVAALNYGNRIVQFPIVVASSALGTALMPHLSQLAAERDWFELRRTAHRYMLLSLVITIPVAVGLFFFSTPIVGLVFQRGAFKAEDVLLVSRIQAFYALQIPSYLVSIIVVRLISSLQANHLLLFVTSINLVINIVLNYTFMRWLGLPGIALSTSVVYIVSTTLCYFIIMRRLHKLMREQGSE
jgi:putative peptidoglycan lipid II flippase